MSRRTETAYKAQSPGKLAQHNEARDSGDRVNAAVVWGKITSLSGEICPACGSNAAHHAAMHGVTGQKSAEAIVVSEIRNEGPNIKQERSFIRFA